MSESYTLFHTQFTSWKVYLPDWLAISGQTSQGLLYFTNSLLSFFSVQIHIIANTNIQPLFLFVELVLRLILLDVVLVPRLKVFRQHDIPDGKQNFESHLHVMMVLT